MTTNAELLDLRRRRRPWRLLLVAAVVVLTVCTHWPKLEFGPEVPATDKTIHFVAFALATYLLWRTAWFNLFTVMLAGLAWAGLDEATQGLPGINRNVSWSDFLANGAGILTMTAWLWALAPLGGPFNRHRLAANVFAYDLVFLKPDIWYRGLLVGIACAVPAAVVWSFGVAWLTRALIVVGILVALHIGVFMVVRRWRPIRAEIAHNRRCVACGTPVPDAAPAGSDLEAVCTVCGTEAPFGAWGRPAAAPADERLKMMRGPLVVGVVVVVLLFAAILVAPAVYEHFLDTPAGRQSAPRALRTLLNALQPLASTVDRTILGLLVAVAVRFYRRSLARYAERGHWCRRCRHDLRYTADLDGAGACGECGLPFRRTEPA